MKKFISSILLVFLLLLSSCSNKEYYNFNFKANSINPNEIYFSNEEIGGCALYYGLTEISFKKHDIDYIFDGDEINITCEKGFASSTCGTIGGIEFYNIKRVKIKRAPIINLTVTTYEENGVEYKKIVADNKKIVLDKQYKNQDIIVFTGQNDVKDITCTLDYEYSYETLYNLEEGTKISATYYEKDGITYIYGFYLRSYVNKVKYFTL